VEESGLNKIPDNPITPDQLQLGARKWKLLFVCVFLLTPFLWKYRNEIFRGKRKC
jgi:hypothetical protein